MTLGLTGGYCAGKNAVAALLEERGWACVDVDKLGHEAVELGKDRIVARFGPGVLSADGRVDRAALGRIVFSDPAALADQEAIVHPVALRLLDERVVAIREAASAAGREPLVCLNAALLYVAPQAASCDAVIEVRAPLLLRLMRARRRDGLGSIEALKRIYRQRRLWRRRYDLPVPVVFLDNDGARGALGGALDRALRQAISLVHGRDPTV